MSESLSWVTDVAALREQSEQPPLLHGGHARDDAAARVVLRGTSLRICATTLLNGQRYRQMPRFPRNITLVAASAATPN